MGEWQGFLMPFTEVTSGVLRSPMTRIVTEFGSSPRTALVVDPALDELVQEVSLLTSLGWRVVAAENFAQAKAVLASQPPAVLITALQLGDYNGLHLVLRAKSSTPQTAALITSTAADPVLLSEAEALGATFVLKPIPSQELTAAILRTVARGDMQLPPLRPPFERRTKDRRGTVLPFNGERRGSDRRQPLPWVTSGSETPV